MWSFNDDSTEATRLWASVIVVAATVLLYPISSYVYSLFFHPLAKIPGPLLWRLSRIPYVKSLWSGNLAHRVQQLHEQYGDVVRIAPDEVSFAVAEAWNEVYGWRHGHPLNKTRVWHQAPKNVPKSVLNALDHQEHARLRRAMQPGFTDAALLAQEPLVQQYVGLFIQRLGDKHQDRDEHEDGERDRDEPNSSWATVDIVQWLNFLTLDIIGDFGFGEPFNCLQSGELHPWVSIIYSFFKSIVFGASLQFFPMVARLMGLYTPKSVMLRRQQMLAISQDKLDRRLQQKTERPDLIGSVHRRQDDEKSGEGMTLPELYRTANVIITAGSETTVSVLSGIIDHLIREPKTSLDRLTFEIRQTFETESAITFQAVKTLAYLNAVIKEGLRMCNPTPVGAPREAPEGGADVCGFRLPEGTIVNVHPLALSLSPKRFHHADEFIPERWLDAKDRSSPFHSDERRVVQTFGVGARSCLGQNLAMAELRLILARLVWAFDLKDIGEPRLKWEERKSYVLVDKGTLKIHLRPRVK